MAVFESTAAMASDSKTMTLNNSATDASLFTLTLKITTE